VTNQIEDAGKILVEPREIDSLKSNLITASLLVQEGDSEGAIHLIATAYWQLNEINPAKEGDDYRRRMN
jgi:hypothetical protein